MEFAPFQFYNRLVARGLANHILCPACGMNTHLVSHNDEPALKCFWCGLLTDPGQNVYDQVCQAVKDHGGPV